MCVVRARVRTIGRESWLQQNYLDFLISNSLPSGLFWRRNKENQREKICRYSNTKETCGANQLSRNFKKNFWHLCHIRNLNGKYIRKASTKSFNSWKCFVLMEECCGKVMVGTLVWKWQTVMLKEFIVKHWPLLKYTPTFCSEISPCFSYLLVLS